MNLTAEDVKLFYKLDWGLMFYANQKFGVIKEITKPDFKGMDMEKISTLKGKMYSNPEIIESFISENPFKFDDEELVILQGWKNFIKDKFFVYQHKKEYSVLLQGDKKPKAYGVLGISDPLECMIPFTPMMIKTVLLPFKGKIIYNGVFSSYNLMFGGGMRKSLKDEYSRAKATFGIITSLDSETGENADKDAELIKFYVQNRVDPQHRDELIKLLNKKPELNNIYTFEMGRKYTRAYRKNLKHLNVKNCWFAVFLNTIIASGESEKEAMERAKKLIPEDEAAGIFVFEHKR